MSCTIAGSIMVMRAEVRRNVAGTDGYGHQKPATGNLQIVQDAMPCHVRIETAREIVDGKEVAIESIIGLFRHDADLKRDDRIEQIKDRRDRVVFAGPLLVDLIVEKFDGARNSYKEVKLRRHRG